MVDENCEYLADYGEVDWYIIKDGKLISGDLEDDEAYFNFVNSLEKELDSSTAIYLDDIEFYSTTKQNIRDYLEN